MLGGRSIQLARVFGIRIGVDASWFIVLFLVIWSLSGAFDDVVAGETASFALSVLTALLFFGSIVLHELGHAIVAIRNRIEIAGIDLWLLGGLARMRRDADSAGVEFRIAAAGPAVSLLIALACLGGGILIEGGFRPLFEDPGTPVGAMLSYLAYINAALLVLNMIPAFPLDGGRIARAIVWWRTGDRGRATKSAARIGRGFGYAFIGLGLFLFLRGAVISGIWLGFIGMFLSQAAKASEVQTQVTSRIEGLSVADVMDAEPVAMPVGLDLVRAMDEFFLRYGWPWFPVIDATGVFRGLVRREKLEEVPEDARSWRTVEEVMSRDAGSVRVDDPLEALLGSESLQAFGGIAAVDADGVLRGVVTVDQVRRALRPPAPAA
ncbi:MAG TPA: site-2 protease family protein [Thermoleophilaceae bacterium]|nr:site-2 protease family protein [Thermoleophilaceae bacterium]